MNTAHTGRRTSWLVFAALMAVLLLLAAWRPLALPDEGRYGDVGRWMLVSGDWLAPRLDGLPFFHKPPLLHWLQALSMTVFGVHPWSARLVPALHAGLMLLGMTLLFIAALAFYRSRPPMAIALIIFAAMPAYSFLDWLRVHMAPIAQDVYLPVIARGIGFTARCIKLALQRFPQVHRAMMGKS